MLVLLYSVRHIDFFLLLFRLFASILLSSTYYQEKLCHERPVSTGTLGNITSAAVQLLSRVYRDTWEWYWYNYEIDFLVPYRRRERQHANSKYRGHTENSQIPVPCGTVHPFPVVLCDTS